METFGYYIGFALLIFIIYGMKSQKWFEALYIAALWPLWVGYIIISLFWGIGSKF